MKVLIFIVGCIACLTAVAQPTLRLSPLSTSVGVAVTDLPNEWQTDTSLTTIVMVRQGLDAWTLAMPLTLVTVRGLPQLRSSIIDLKPGTELDVKITVLGNTNAATVLDATATTKSLQLPSPQGPVLYVGPTGSGTTYTREKPGSFKTLLSGGLPCGTTVVLLEGVYENDFDMTLNITTSCDEGAPIIIMAEPWKKAVLSGGTDLTANWNRTAADTAEWYHTLPDEMAYTALVVGESGKRLYPYALRYPSPNFPNYPSLKDLGYEVDGFYRTGGTIFTRKFRQSINSAVVRTSRRWSCLTVNGNGNSANLYIIGLSCREFGNTRCIKNVFGLVDECYPPFTIAMNNIKNVTIANCDFLNTNFPIAFSGETGGICVRGNVISDGVGTWSHGAFKQTRDASVLDQGSYGRYLENVGIWFAANGADSTTDIDIFSNTVDGTIAGISVGALMSKTVIDNVDISTNTVSNCYDGIDIIGGNGGGATNARIRRNNVIGCPVGTSLIYPAFGPFLVTRNTYVISDRKNHNYDAFFVECNNTITDRSWSTALKLNAGTTNSTPGVIQFYHNTIVAKGAAGFGLYLWNNTWDTFTATNNIVVADNSPWMFDGVDKLLTYSVVTDANVYYTPSGPNVAVIRSVHGIANCVSAESVDEFRNSLTSSTTSPNVQIGSRDIRANPLFEDVANADLRLRLGSPAIDMAIRLPGINDVYQGAAPDAGAFESAPLTSVNDENDQLGPDEMADFYDLMGRRLDSLPKVSGLYFKVVSRIRGKFNVVPVLIIH